MESARSGSRVDRSDAPATCVCVIRDPWTTAIKRPGSALPTSGRSASIIVRSWLIEGGFRLLLDLLDPQASGSWGSRGCSGQPLMLSLSNEPLLLESRLVRKSLITCLCAVGAMVVWAGPALAQSVVDPTYTPIRNSGGWVNGAAYLLA